MPYNTRRSATFNPRNLVTSDVPHVIVVHSSAFYDRRRPSIVCPRWPCEAERHRRIQAATKFPSAQGEKRERRSGAALQRRSGAAEHRRTAAAARRRASASAGNRFKYTHTQDDTKPKDNHTNQPLQPFLMANFCSVHYPSQ